MEENKIKKDKEKTDYSYIGSGGIKFSGASIVTLITKVYKKNYWLLAVSSLIVVFLAGTGLFLKPFLSFIINLLVGFGALLGISSWKILHTTEKTSS